jgi:hypothetical protein
LFGLLKIKVLLCGLLLASPPVAAWMLREDPPGRSMTAAADSVAPNAARALNAGAVQVPVEVLAKGSAPQWVYVELPNQAVPEPGVVSLLAVTSLLLLRRQRPGGK